MNNLIICNRAIGTLGLDMYFYNIRTLMIFEYEIKYQLSQGIWSLVNNPRNHADVWMNANLHLTQGKSNVRTVSEFGCNIPKNNYNLKKILDNHRSYSRVKSIGILSQIYDKDYDYLKALLNENFHEYGYILMRDFSDDDDPYKEFMEALSLELPDTRCLIPMIDEDLVYRFLDLVNEYSDSSMRDDLGMIQNTMRNVIEENQGI